MHFKFRHLQKIVGGFFLLTCIIVVILLVMVARGQKWFQPYTEYHCFFNRGGGLKVGASVMIQGLEAGSIKKLSLDDQNQVRVDFEIFSQYSDRIRKDSLAKLVQPMIGSSKLEITLGSPDSPDIRPEGTIPSKDIGGSDLDELIENANKLVKSLENPEGDLMKSLANIQGATKNLSEGLAKKDGSLRQFIEKREFYDNLSSAANHLDSLLTEIDKKSPDISDSITEARKAIEEANKVIKAIQKSIFIRGYIQERTEDATLRAEGRLR
ncbi:MAG: MlaD family protein [Pseudomonadota bacterium]